MASIASGVLSMSRLVGLFGLSLLATSALANEFATNPTYLGRRSNNPEQETYGIPVDDVSLGRTLAFVGPAHSVGSVTGDPEKDTVAYTPFFIDSQACRPGPTHTANVELGSE